jgi:glycosyltransferase involved in cell wall biosynthesis
MKRLPSLSIFFPSLNDAQMLPILIKKAQKAAKQCAVRYEIIVIDDGSTDNTQAVLRRLQKTMRNLVIVTHKTNRGYGGALKSGFARARYAWIFYTDGDGQYNPLELSRLVKLVTPTIDVVNGYKANRADPWIRIVLGNLYNWIAHRIQHLPIRDIDCDFRLIRKHALAPITLESNTGKICFELITKLAASGARFAQTPVSHFPRTYGSSEFFRLTHLLRTLSSWFRT